MGPKSLDVAKTFDLQVLRDPPFWGPEPATKAIETQAVRTVLQLFSLACRTAAAGISLPLCSLPLLLRPPCCCCCLSASVDSAAASKIGVKLDPPTHRQASAVPAWPLLQGEAVGGRRPSGQCHPLGQETAGTARPRLASFLHFGMP
jgi:hypothetical protein